MILKLAFKEEKKHYIMYMFMKLQLAITFLILITCVSVVTSQYGIYKGFSGLFQSDGMFVQSTFGVRVPEEISGNGVSGKAILEQSVKNADIISSYHLLGDFFRGGDEEEWNAIVYDDKLSEAYMPLLEEGRWLEKGEDGAWELRAVISPDNYGIEVGDNIVFRPYENGIGNIKVKIVGKLKENSRIVRFQPSDDMVGYQNFISTYDFDDGFPTILFLKSDFDGLLPNSGIGEKLLWPAGMMFIKYREEIEEAEEKKNEDFFQNYLDVRIMEPLEEVKEKSLLYLKEQIMEILPILMAALFFSFLTTICISALGARHAVKDYMIYRLSGLPFHSCKKIQLCLNGIILGKGILIAFLAGFVLKMLVKEPKFLFGFGVWQIGTCVIGSAVWLAVSFTIQKRILKNPEFWRRKSCD